MTRERPEIIDLDTRPIPAAPVDRVRPSGRPGLGSGGRDSGAPEAPAPAQAMFEVPRPSGRIVCEGLVKIYKVADLEVVALQGLDLHIDPGEFVAIIGASGSGKSTLMHILGGLDAPSAGKAVVANHDLTALDRGSRTDYRRRVIGFVWQQTARNLLSYLTARQNVELPMLLAGMAQGEREERAQELLERVGLGERADHKPSALSGGEQQRVAIAVAIANRPSVLFADEPTGELDSATAHEVFDLLRSLNQELGITIVVVTHDPLVSEQVSRTIAIRDGRTSTETLRRRAVTEAGDHHVIAEEYAVLDRVGRLQLPRAHVEALGLERRVRLVLEDDHIEIWPDTGDGSNGAGGESKS